MVKLRGQQKAISQKSTARKTVRGPKVDVDPMDATHATTIEHPASIVGYAHAGERVFVRSQPEAADGVRQAPPERLPA